MTQSTTRNHAQGLRRLWGRNLLTFGALLLLLVATLVLAYVPLGPGNAPLAIGIAAIKAGLVLWVYMELSSARATTRLVALTAFLFATVLFGLAGLEVLTRGP